LPDRSTVAQADTIDAQQVYLPFDPGKPQASNGKTAISPEIKRIVKLYHERVKFSSLRTCKNSFSTFENQALLQLPHGGNKQESSALCGLSPCTLKVKIFKTVKRKTFQSQEKILPTPCL
jgi:hypothetical protein